MNTADPDLVDPDRKDNGPRKIAFLELCLALVYLGLASCHEPMASTISPLEMYDACVYTVIHILSYGFAAIAYAIKSVRN
jgi:hypothetical protein